MKRVLLTVVPLFTLSLMALAQADLAYMPKAAPPATADDARITMLETEEEGIVELVLPSGTFRIDLLNAFGNVVDRFDPAEAARFDLRQLKPGTWTLRACTPQGFRVRRFVVHQREGSNWVVEATAPPKRKR